jgi:hypothetical protein
MYFLNITTAKYTESLQFSTYTNLPFLIQFNLKLHGTQQNEILRLRYS